MILFAVPRDPAFCFNHQDTPSQFTCADCGEKFCDGCVVVLEGQTLCGPCKNFRIGNLHRPTQLSLMAIFSPIVALLGGFFGLCLSGVAAQANVPAFGVVGVLPQLVALLLGFAGLRQIETNPHVGGRALAMTGIVAALVCAILNGVMIIVMERAI